MVPVAGSTRHRATVAPMGTEITVSVDIPATRQDVWDDLSSISSHSEWMADAESIDFLTEANQGVGTRISVATRIGPLRTTDVMEFVEWSPPERMSVEHQGLFTGSGAFVLEETTSRSTRFTWSERIRFPWYLGGRIGELVARPILRWVWRRNLTRFRERFSGP